jgi:hypothetical protein
VRRLTSLGALLLACASPGTPPGGPVDEDPPVVVRVRPDTNAVNVRQGSVGFEFDEVISERPQGSGSLAELFLISPSRGRNELAWKRTRLEVRPRGGLRPNTTYRVTMLPGLTDLDGNVDSVGRTIVFSTGSTLASGRVTGTVFEWLEERPARGALVEAIVLPDSTRYSTVADSLGHYELLNLPAGRFVLRGLVDLNRNRELDPREVYDTLTIALTDSLVRPLHAILRDTLGPGIERIEMLDSLRLRVRFDRALDTTLVITPGLFTLKRADSTVIPIQTAVGGRVYQRELEDSARAKAVQDSIRAANDTTRRDTTRVAVRPAAPRPPPAAARPDTTPPPPRPAVRIPEIEAVLRLESPIPAGTAYRLRAANLRSITGYSRSSERAATTPRARPRADSARRDTTRRDTLALRESRLAQHRTAPDVGGPPHRENTRAGRPRRYRLLPGPILSPPPA